MRRVDCDKFKYISSTMKVRFHKSLGRTTALNGKSDLFLTMRIPKVDSMHIMMVQRAFNSNYGAATATLTVNRSLALCLARKETC